MQETKTTQLGSPTPEQLNNADTLGTNLVALSDWPVAFGGTITDPSDNEWTPSELRDAAAILTQRLADLAKICDWIDQQPRIGE